ncbi:hypothetical protein BD324DRAFT_611111 [Kockovaella imperatae]|uniref:Uncharacterized protein n=1 Tax=Kockovaella imperatae TaxID=4999 RepID=A0A1Y1USW5_9TREE|nr:hypothetical protein BD324DRAFT_611111 [Kockovaella imperatae]ORX40526.1 hypothetical protein BD324DRAFT_611111 [Kockovaella imperatae]
MSVATAAPGPRIGPIDPHTQRFMLSLPPLMHSISPTLAAVHLARARLWLSISTAGQLSEGWCHSCGGLRQGYGGTSKKRRKHDQIVPVGHGVEAELSTTGKRKTPNCMICGAPFRRAQPNLASQRRFPSARIARRKQALDAANIASQSGPSMPLPRVMPFKPKPSSSPPPHLLAQPTTSHILFDPPTPPTYPQPPRLVPLEQKPGKRKKRSGLAKLLAENKERNESNQSGGSWGLG